MPSPAPVLQPIIEGSPGGDTLFFIQGWPDDHTLWDELVEGLGDRYRCVRVDMPNYGGAVYRRWGFSHDAIVQGLADCIRKVSPDRPVTLIGHDWGAYWTYRTHRAHPELVGRIVGLDVAPELTPTLREILYIIAYQWWLLAAFVIGGPIGNWMTRRCAKLARSPRQGAGLYAGINYPYLYTWRDIVTGRAAKISRGYSPDLPHLFVYGAAKPVRFHTDRWLELVRSRPGNEVVALDGRGHWVTRDPRLKGLVRDWLAKTAVG